MEAVLDSSFLLELVSRPLKRIEELEVVLGRVEFVVLETTVRELEKLASKAGVRGRKASAALEYVRGLKKVKLMYEDLDADSAVTRYALEHGSAVATVDQSLRRRLKSAGVPVITLRGDNVWVDR